MSNFDYDQLDQSAEDAPQAGYGPNLNFGKLSTDANIISWVGPKDSREMQTRPLVKGDKADKDKGEYIRLTFGVNISEFNPSLDWTYEREVDMKVNGPRAKTNWSEIVLPSLLAVFGKDWAKKIAKDPYVAVEDADDINGRTSKKSGKVLSVPKFIAAYKNKAECKQAWEEKYSKRNSSNSDTDGEEIPAAVISQVQALVNALPGGAAEALPMLEDNKPYGNYSGVELLTAAGFEPPF